MKIGGKAVWEGSRKKIFSRTLVRCIVAEVSTARFPSCPAARDSREPSTKARSIPDRTNTRDRARRNIRASARCPHMDTRTKTLE